MGVPTLKIILDNPTGSYYAGTTVTGRVHLKLDHKEKFRGIKIEFEGEAHVSWKDTENQRNSDGEITYHTVNYSSNEEYFSNKYYVIGGAYHEVEIPAGEHVYQFTTTLPPQLPTSFEGEHGYVRYTIEATLDRPWKMDYVAKKVFQVVTPLDLNYHALAKLPVKKEEFKTFCCFCCKSGPLTVVACLPHTGYVPGQDILATIEVDNASNIIVDCIKLKVVKTLKWIVRSPSQKTKVENIELSKMSLEGVDVNASKTLTQKITIPQMPFVNLDACSIINVTFILEVTACVSGMCKQNLSVEIPLVIGTVPIYNPLDAGSTLSPPMGIMDGQTQPSPLTDGFGQPLPLGFNTNSGNTMPDTGYSSLPYSQNQYGVPGGGVYQSMYPQSVYPNSNFAKLSPEDLVGFNTSGATIPSAPPFESDVSLLITPE